MTSLQYIEINRKLIKNWSKIITMKLEAVVFGVMQVATINYKSSLPDLTSIINSGAA